tara:strand:- start:218 stop:466 length:249 start_codon:yes stop_codon:yes gene_type:complete
MDLPQRGIGIALAAAKLAEADPFGARGRFGRARGLGGRNRNGEERKSGGGAGKPPIVSDVRTSNYPFCLKWIGNVLDFIRNA